MQTPVTIKLLYIQQEDLEIEITPEMGFLIRDNKKDCEIELSPEITAQLLSFANIIIQGFVEAKKRGFIPEELSPDWR